MVVDLSFSGAASDYETARKGAAESRREKILKFFSMAADDDAIFGSFVVFCDRKCNIDWQRYVLPAKVTKAIAEDAFVPTAGCVNDGRQPVFGK
jgi:hypothetical protein